MKGKLSKGVRLFRNGVKRASAKLAAIILRSKSYPLLGVPCGVTTGLGADGGAVRSLFPPAPVNTYPPKTIDPALFWQFEASLTSSYISPEEGVLTLPRGMATHIGSNLSSKGKLVVTFYQPIDGKSPERSDIFRFSTKRFWPRIYKSDVPVITLTTGWQGAFYHWVFEVLPRLALVEKGGYSLQESKLYVEARAPFQKQSLELLDIPQERMINADEYEAVVAPTLVIPSIPQVPSLRTCQFLRDKFLPKLSSRPPLRLYVSRNDAPRRRVVNEDAVFRLLSQYGFEKYEMCNFSFKEQAELFQAADAVVAPHGAGLSHLVFCKPSTPVLEFFDPAYFNGCYWHISDRIGLKYHYLFGEGVFPKPGVSSGLDPDITIDLTKLEASLKLMQLG